MIIEATSSDFQSLLRARAPRHFHLVADSLLAPADVLAMLANLAADIARDFTPSAWLIVENNEVVGLCSLVKTPQDGELALGYGLAPSRWGRGIATLAVADVVHWAQGDARVRCLAAETATDNLASQRVLAANGFQRTGERIDAEDGPVISWRHPLER